MPLDTQCSCGNLIPAWAIQSLMACDIPKALWICSDCEKRKKKRDLKIPVIQEQTGGNSGCDGAPDECLPADCNDC